MAGDPDWGRVDGWDFVEQGEMNGSGNLRPGRGVCFISQGFP